MNVNYPLAQVFLVEGITFPSATGRTHVVTYDSHPDIVFIDATAFGVRVVFDNNPSYTIPWSNVRFAVESKEE